MLAQSLTPALNLDVEEKSIYGNGQKLVVISAFQESRLDCCGPCIGFQTDSCEFQLRRTLLLLGLPSGRLAV